MSILIGSARANENGQKTNGLPGDQKQTSLNDMSGEVSMQGFYVHSKGWYVLRPKSSIVAINLAAKMIYACNNICLGYDQGSTRLGVIQNGISTIVPTGCDCSSLVRACVKEASNIDPGNFNTDNEVSALLKTGLFEDKVEYTEGMVLKRGDVLVTKTKGHTAIVVLDEVTKVTTKNQNESDNASVIWKLLKNHGFSDIATAGIMGNLHAESGLRGNNLQNSFEKKYNISDDTYTYMVNAGAYGRDMFISDKAGYGLAQWTSSGRKGGLYDLFLAKRATNSGLSIADISLQIEWLKNEIESNKGLNRKLKAAQSVKEASDIIMHNYERPADQSESVENKRAEYSQMFFDKFHKETKSEQFVESKQDSGSFRIKVDVTNLNIRKGPGLEYDITGKFTGVGTFLISESKDNWGKLASGSGWICLDYAERI